MPQRNNMHISLLKIIHNSLKNLKFQNNLIYFQHDGCKWLLTFHIQHCEMKKKHNWPIIDNHNKMTHSCNINIEIKHVHVTLHCHHPNYLPCFA